MIRHVCSYGGNLKHLWLAFMFALLLPFASQAHAAYSASELDTLVSTIALYPDPLLVHVLNASVYSDDIPSASAFAQAHKYEKGEDLAYAIERARLSYDESVIALIPFPDVLRKMAKYRTWTAQLGYAVKVQRDDVYAAVQRLRVVAYNFGHLRSNEWVNVNTDGYVTINPVEDEYIYVPEYNPRYVFYAAADNVLRVHYAPGILLGTWFLNWGWEPFVYDWRYHRPVYRYSRHYRMPPPRHYGSYPRHNPPPPSPRFGHKPPPQHEFRDNPPPQHFRDNPPPNRDRRNPPSMRDDRNSRHEGHDRPDWNRNEKQMQSGNSESVNPPPQSNPPSSRRPSFDENSGNSRFDGGRRGGNDGDNHHFGGRGNHGFDGGRHDGGDSRRGGNPPPRRR